MNNIKVELLNATPIEYFIKAIRTCWDSHTKSDSSFICENNKIGSKDEDLMDKIVNKHKHHSTMEHIFFNFKIKGISRLCLQELARHRIASFSVKSTRYTLKELKQADFIKSLKEAKNFIVLIGNEIIDSASLKALQNIQTIIKENTINLDEVKYCLPECYRTELMFSINARSLRNFLELRASPSAHFEIRNLANKIYFSLDENYRKYLFSNIQYLSIKN